MVCHALRHRDPRPVPAPCRDHHHHWPQLSAQGPSGNRAFSQGPPKQTNRRTRSLPGTAEVNYTMTPTTGRFTTGRF
jgi:hypothetical protein